MIRRTILTMLAFAVLSGAAARAQVVRTFVSTEGVDNPSCFLASPCRTFSAAIAAVAPGGEVVVLDSGGYGAFTVNKSVSVIAPQGVYAAIAASTGAAVTVHVLGNDAVVLRGLQIYGQGATTGISFTQGRDLFIEDCVVSGFTERGISMARSGTFGQLFVKNSVIRENGTGAVGSGIYTITNDVEGNWVSVDRSLITANALGIHSGNNSNVVVTRSLVAGNENYALYPGNGEITVEDSVLAHQASGIWAASTAGTARMSNTGFIAHVGGLAVSQSGSAVVLSRQNNFGGQQTGTSGTITPLAGQ